MSKRHIYIDILQCAKIIEVGIGGILLPSFSTLIRGNQTGKIFPSIFKAVTIAVSVFVFFFSENNAAAHIQTLSSSGTPLRWAMPNQYPIFYTNWSNTSGLSYNSVFNLFTQALQRWKYSTQNNSIQFDYWQGNNKGTPTTTDYDGKSSVFFSSASSEKLGNGTLCVTIVWSTSGAILESDVEFNDDLYTFTTNPTDTSVNANGRVFLQNVATHEFGHAFGLAHSAVLQSSMVFRENRAQNRPSCDDLSGISQIYPTSNFAALKGRISGTILNGSTAVYGAHVLAISRSRGVVLASSITDSSGRVVLDNLEPEEYFLFVEPFQASSPISSLCGGSSSGCYFGSVNSNQVCTGSPFKRKFVESSPGVPQVYNITSGSNITFGSIDVGCSDLTGTTTSSTIGSAPILLNNVNGTEAVATRIAVSGAMSTNQFYKLQNISGNLKVHVMSYSIYSPFDPSITLLDSSGNEITTAQVNLNRFTNDTSYINYDAAVSANNLALGDYYIRVTNNSLPLTSRYPAGSVSGQIDTVRYYLLNVLLNKATPTLTFADNARCESSDNFTSFEDHGPPADVAPTSSASSSSSTTQTKKIGGCGMIENHSKNDSNNSALEIFCNSLFSIWGVFGILFMLRMIQKSKVLLSFSLKKIR